MKAMSVYQTITTDEEALKYLPDYPEAITLYTLYRAQGMPIKFAMTKVLEAWLGRPRERE